MAEINCANVKIFARLVECGFTTEKQIVGMSIGDLVRIPKIKAVEIRGINAFQKAIKAGNTLSFFVDEECAELKCEEREASENYEA